MEDSNIARAAAISVRINGPVVVMDGTGDPVVVVPLSSYEEMIGTTGAKSLTSPKGFATINRDIALENPGSDAQRPAPGSAVSSASVADEEYYMEPLE